MGCRHPNVAHGIWANGTWDEWIGGANSIASERERCLDCGAWLPLGPSNDEPAEVRVEMRAAELAARPISEASIRDRQGWLVFVHNTQPGADDYSPAGYLAAAIATHDEEQRS